MKQLLLTIIIAFSCATCFARGEQDTLTWRSFVDKHPKCMKTNVIYEGCSLLLCSDGEYLFVQLNILHPAMQMRILMQGLTLYIDPTGKKKEKFAIIFPSANEVHDVMTNDEFNPAMREQGDERPDISPLISSLQRYGAFYDVKGKVTTINKNMYSMMLNEGKNILSYSVLIPIGDMLNEKKVSQMWSIGLYSEGGRMNNDGPGFEAQSARRMPQMPMQRQPEMDDQENMRKIMSKDIDSWTKFSLANICSLND